MKATAAVHGSRKPVRAAVLKPARRAISEEVELAASDEGADVDVACHGYLPERLREEKVVMLQFEVETGFAAVAAAGQQVARKGGIPRRHASE